MNGAQEHKHKYPGVKKKRNIYKLTSLQHRFHHEWKRDPAASGGVLRTQSICSTHTPPQTIQTIFKTYDVDSQEILWSVYVKGAQVCLNGIWLTGAL